MPHTITIELPDQSLTGQVTDMDALFFAGLILPEYFQIRDQETGLRAAFDKFSTDNADLLAKAGGNSAGLADEMYAAWGERLLIRLTDNLTIRSAFAQRVCEIFPDVRKDLIYYDRWTDKDGNIHENSRIRLDLDSVMEIITPAIAVLNAEEKSGQAASTAPAEEEDLKQTVHKLQAELAKLQSQTPALTPSPSQISS
ncbi:MAG: hypothetical protein QNJ46_09565 [Leptolyngbyaceae cyanobacterium MO_188.B28]|nr:hypothetical protein [Leptolyngbyaceae cyanobacterium MO_188.B28]